jgi:hypothetical protein
MKPRLRARLDAEIHRHLVGLGLQPDVPCTTPTGTLFRRTIALLETDPLKLIVISSSLPSLKAPDWKVAQSRRMTAITTMMPIRSCMKGMCPVRFTAFLHEEVAPRRAGARRR